MTIYARWQWAKDRLAAISVWRILWGLVMPVGFAAFWFIVNLRHGQTAWAVIFGLLLALSIVVEVAAVTLKLSRRRQAPAPLD